MLGEHVVERLCEVELEQARKASEREARALERQRLSIGQANADDLPDRITGVELQSLGHCLARGHLHGRQDAGARRDVLAPQLLGEAREGAEVPLELG